MSFVQRQIDVSFNLATGSFHGGGNAFTFTAIQTPSSLSGPPYDPNIPRVTASIIVAGGLDGINLVAEIYGMPLSVMNQLTVAGKQYNQIPNNEITLSAGDDTGGVHLVFKGALFSAFMDGSSQPNVCFRVQARGTGYIDVKPAKPTSIKGSADVAQIMQQLCRQASLKFENNGVQCKLRNPYLWSSAGLQIKKLAQMAGIEHIVEKGVLAIWPSGQARSAAGTVFISPETGMVGYPTFNKNAIIVRTVFNPKVLMATSITVQSSITAACGDWIVTYVMHEIAANAPRGPWFTTIEAGPGGGGGSLTPSGT